MTTAKKQGAEKVAATCKQTVGKVAPKERDEIKILFERKEALKELLRSLMDMPKNELEGNSVYEKLITDMAKTTSAFKAWWDTKSAKYNWDGKPGHSWHINFETCEVYLGTNHALPPGTKVSC